MVDQPVDDIELVKERTPDSPILVLRIPEWDLGDRMLKCLRVANMSAKQMAAYLEVSETTITNWVRGRTQPSAASLRAWADITHVSLDWLREGWQPRVRRQGLEPRTRWLRPSDRLSVRSTRVLVRAA